MALIVGAPPLKVLLIGCGLHASAAHLPGVRKFVAETGRAVALYIADLSEPDTKPRSTPVESWFIQLPKPEQDLDGKKAIARLSEEHQRRQFDACMIATRPRYHKRYAEWALQKGIPLMVEKPLTFPDDAHYKADQSRKIVSEFDELLKMAKPAGRAPLTFILGAQKRYQAVYRELGQTIRRVYEATGCPVTNVVCTTGDGWWLLPAEYEKHSYRSGGKLTHTGYHLLDIVPWLMRHASTSESPLPITHAWVIASVFRPADAVATYGTAVAKKLFRLEQSMSSEGRDLGDINSNLMVRFCDKENRQRASVLYSLLHEGFSRRSASSERRTKIDYLALTQGPVLWAELRRIAKMVDGDGEGIGQQAHQELTVLCREFLVPLGSQATLTVSNQPLHAADTEVNEYCENDEAPTIDFLKQVAMPGKQTSLSPVEDHGIGVKLLAAAYESAADCAAAPDGMPKAIRVDFGQREWRQPPGTA